MDVSNSSVLYPNSFALCSNLSKIALPNPCLCESGDTLILLTSALSSETFIKAPMPITLPSLELLDLLVEFQEKILRKLSKGCDIRQNHKPYVENNRTSVKHFHFHIYPRDLND